MAEPAQQVPELAYISDPLASARIPVLLVPVGNITRRTWDKWTSQILRFTELRLNDIPGTSGGPASKSDKARFLPPSSPPPNTHIHLSYTSVPPRSDVLPFSLLQVSAFPLAVIGISDLSDTRTNHNQKIGQFQKTLQKLDVNHANGMVYPLARRCFGVEEDVSAFPLGSTPRAGNFPSDNKSTPNLTDSSTNTPRRVEESSTFEGMVEIDASEGSDLRRAKSEMGNRDQKMYDRKGHEEKMVVIPKDGNVEIVLGMLMADLVASVLTEFGDIITALENPAGSSILQASMLPTLTIRNTPRLLSAPSASVGESIPRPRSTNYSLVAVSNTALPLNTTSTSPSRPTSATGYSIPGVTGSASVPTSLGSSDRPTNRPQSVIGTSTFGGDPNSRGFGNVPGPSPATPDSRGAASSAKRASTGFSLSSSVGRVMSGTKHVTNPMDIVSTSSPVGNASSSPTPSSATGRLKKVTADLWLLSGRLQEAISCYTECLSTFKSHNDAIWHASACEGLATANLLEAWETRNPEDGHIPLLASPVLSGAHDLMVQAQSLYEKSICPPESLFPQGAESGESVIARLYTLCALRTARLLICAWSAGGLGAASLHSLVDGRMPRSYPPMDYAHRRRVFLKLTTMSKISRSLITRTAARAHGPWLASLPSHLQLDVLVDLANMQRLIGLERREMLYDRELYGAGITALSASLQNPRASERGNRNRSASLSSQHSLDSVVTMDGETDLNDGSQTYGNTTSISITASAAGFVAAKRPDHDEGTNAVIKLVDRTLNIVGIDLAVASDAPGSSICSRYGWPELQVESIRDAVTAAEALSDHQSVMRFAACALRTLAIHLAPHSQLYLYQAYARAWSTAKRRGLIIPERQWWIPDGLFVALELSPLAANKIPYEQSVATATSNDRLRDPFLYNPRARVSSGGKMVYVQDERIECIITLANPLSFEIELQDLSLATSGIAVECTPLSLVLAADSTVRIPITLIPSEAGNLALLGIRLRLPDGQEEVLSIPEQKIPARLAKPPAGTKEKRQSGTTTSEIRPDRRRKAAGVSGAMTQFCGIVDCQVIPAQPLMWIRGTNLNHGSLITMDGEQTHIRLVLENISSQPIDFIKLTFKDSLADQSEKILSEGDADLVQTYEIEADLEERPVFIWEHADQPISISPGAQQTISVRCLGKLGCENGVIRIDYACLGASRNDQEGDFYSRRISFPIITTVQPTLRCRHIGLKPSPRAYDSHHSQPIYADEDVKAMKQPSRPKLSGHHSSYQHDLETQADLQVAMARASARKVCLASILFHNPSDQALEVHIERQEDATAANPVISRLIAPKASERLVIPLARSRLTTEETDRPVPQSKLRQFVVSRYVKSPKDHQASLERFWYREKLLRSIQARWTLPGSNRSGNLTLRHLVISDDTIESYKNDNIDIHTTIEAEGSEIDVVDANKPVDIKIAIRNSGPECQATCKVNVHPSTAAKMALEQNLQPDLESFSRNFVFDGDVEETTMRLATGDNTRIIRAAFLAKGTYDVATTLITKPTGIGSNTVKTLRGQASIKVVI